MENIHQEKQINFCNSRLRAETRFSCISQRRSVHSQGEECIKRNKIILAIEPKTNSKGHTNLIRKRSLALIKQPRKPSITE